MKFEATSKHTTILTIIFACLIQVNHADNVPIKVINHNTYSAFQKPDEFFYEFEKYGAEYDSNIIMIFTFKEMFKGADIANNLDYFYDKVIETFRKAMESGSEKYAPENYTGQKFAENNPHIAYVYSDDFLTIIIRPNEVELVKLDPDLPILKITNISLHSLMNVFFENTLTADEEYEDEYKGIKHQLGVFGGFICTLKLDKLIIYIANINIPFIGDTVSKKAAFKRMAEIEASLRNLTLFGSLNTSLLFENQELLVQDIPYLFIWGSDMNNSFDDEVFKNLQLQAKQTIIKDPRYKPILAKNPGSLSFLAKNLAFALIRNQSLELLQTTDLAKEYLDAFTFGPIETAVPTSQDYFDKGMLKELDINFQLTGSYVPVEKKNFGRKIAWNEMSETNFGYHSRIFFNSSFLFDILGEHYAEFNEYDKLDAIRCSAAKPVKLKIPVDSDRFKFSSYYLPKSTHVVFQTESEYPTLKTFDISQIKMLKGYGKIGGDIAEQDIRTVMEAHFLGRGFPDISDAPLLVNAFGTDWDDGAVLTKAIINERNENLPDPKVVIPQERRLKMVKKNRMHKISV